MRLLRNIRGLRLDVTELDSIGEPRNGPVQQLLKKKSGRTTVPQVFVNDEFIGGDDDMKRLASAGGLERAGRREPLHIVVAADEFIIHEDLRHGRPTGPLLQKLLNRPVARFPDTIELGDIHAQTPDLTKHAQRVLRVGSVRLAEDDGRVSERELRLD